MFYVPQISNDDCGLACLKMLLIKFHKDKNYQYLKVDESKKWYSYEDLIRIAEENSLSLIGAKVTNKNEIKKSGNFPFIVSLEYREGKKHAVIVTGVGFGRVRIMDPAVGSYSMSYKKFMALWDSTVLLIEGFEVTKCEKKDECKVIKESSLFLTYILHFLSGCCFIAGLYFLTPNDNIALCIGLFVLGLLFQIILKYFLLRLMKKFDLLISNKHLITGNKYDFFIRTEQFKTVNFSTKLNLIYYFLISGFIIVISILNNYWNLILFVTSLLIALIDSFILYPLNKNKAREIQIEEERLKIIKDTNQFEKNIASIRSNSYKLAEWVSFKKIIYVFISILVSFLLSFLTEFSLTNIVFDVCVTIFLTNNLIPLFTYNDKINEKRYHCLRLNNLLVETDNS